MPNYEGVQCKQCGEVIQGYSRSGYCRKCWHERRGSKIATKTIKQPIYVIDQETRIANTIEAQKDDLYNYHSVSIDGVPTPVHRYIWEREHKRNLPHNWVVHHLNGLKGDNRIENLVAMSKSDHDSKDLVNALKRRIRELEQLRLSI